MRFLLTTTALISLLAASPAFAQSRSDEDIVVTATRVPTPALRLPARVDVIGRDAIEAQGLATLPQALGGDAVQSGGAGAQTSLFLRGANSNHTTVLLDGVKLNDESAPNGAYDFGLDTLGGLDRIETVRGPLSAIYGSEAIGGVVNMIPRIGGEKPFSAFGEASYGSFETVRALLGAQGQAGALSYGVSGEYFDTDGYDQTPERFALHTGEHDGATLKTYLGAARYALTDVWSVDALARRRESDSEYDCFCGGGPFDGLRADDPNIHAETEQNVWRLGTDVTPMDVLHLRAAFGRVDQDSREIDASAQTSHTYFVRDFGEASARVTPHGSDFFRDPALTLGFNWATEKAEVSGQFVDAFSAREENHAIYLAGQTGLGPILSATAAVRQDDYETFGQHSTYQAGLVADFDSSGAPVRLYGSYGTAFKAPSLYQRFSTFAAGFFPQIANPDLQPETAKAWEVGADWTILKSDDRAMLQIGATYYHNDVRNLIDLVFTPSFTAQYQNVKSAELSGVESYVAFSPLSWLSARLSYEHTDALNTSVPSEPQLPRRPRNSWRLVVKAQPLPRLRLGVDWGWVGDRIDTTYDDAGFFLSGAGVTEGYNVGAISATYDLTDQLEIFARVDNVSDETYEQPNAFAGAPRSATIGLRGKF